MLQLRLPAVFMRGGTSKGVIFHRRDLPAPEQWDAIFLAAMGSPDPYGRQLNGMGGGVSSLSKICVVGPPSRPDADIDYTFAQIPVSADTVDYSGNCGNMASAVAIFAIDEGLVKAGGAGALVRIHNTNTGKIIHSRFPVADGRACIEGGLTIPGVAGTGAPVRLDFLDPGGAATGLLLPTGSPLDAFETSFGVLAVSLVDAANACAFVRAGDLGLEGNETPAELERNAAAMARLAEVRVLASVRMGLATDEAAAASRPMTPFVAIVSPPQSSATLQGAALQASEMDLSLRVISSGQPHRAAPLTVALCTAAAAAIDGTLVNEAVHGVTGSQVRIGTPSGALVADSEVTRDGALVRAVRGSFYRTARRLFDGFIYV